MSGLFETGDYGELFEKLGDWEMGYDPLSEKARADEFVEDFLALTNEKIGMEQAAARFILYGWLPLEWETIDRTPPGYAKYPFFSIGGETSQAKYDTPEVQTTRWAYWNRSVLVLVTNEYLPTEWRDPMDGTPEYEAGTSLTVVAFKRR